jgi:hypothetical protein
VSVTTADYTYWITGVDATYGERGVGARFVETIAVKRNDGAALDFDTELPALQTQGVVPSLGAVYTGVAGVYGNRARARGFNARISPGNQITVAIQYDTQYVVDPCDGVFRLPSSISYSTVIRSSATYRTGWTVPPPPAANVSADIGGTALAGGQVTVAQNVPQVRIKVSFTQDAVITGLSAAVAATSYANKLNSATFLGVAAGYLLCEGVNIVQTQHEFYTVQFDFLYDVWAHHSQVATLDADGRIQTTSNAPTEVKWKRVERTSVDFNGIYGANTRLQAITERGYWLPCPPEEA